MMVRTTGLRRKLYSITPVRPAVVLQHDVVVRREWKSQSFYDRRRRFTIIIFNNYRNITVVVSNVNWFRTVANPFVEKTPMVMSATLYFILHTYTYSGEYKRIDDVAWAKWYIVRRTSGEQNESIVRFSIAINRVSRDSPHRPPPVSLRQH